MRSNEIVTLKSFAGDVSQVVVLCAEQLIFGSLLVCLLLASQEVVHAHLSRYGEQMSVIASSMSTSA